MLRSLFRETFFRRVQPPGLAPDFVEAVSAGWNALYTGRLEDAERLADAALAAALKDDEARAEALHLRARIRGKRRNFRGALDDYECALGFKPNSIPIMLDMGGLLHVLGRIDEALLATGAIIKIDPRHAAAHANMGMMLCESGDVEAGLVSLGTAIELDPALHEAHNTMGLASASRGDLEAGITSLRRAIALKPDFAEAHSNLIMMLVFDPRTGIEDQFTECRRWQRQHADALRVAVPRHHNSVNACRKLHIGYVSADFRQHAAAYAFGPMLLHYNRSSFDVTCYSNSVQEDAFTVRYQKAVDRWRNICGMPDAEAERLVREDHIDILVDLSGHTAGNCLLLFARKPAPIQVTAWGQFCGTGLDAMDYIFADRVLISDEMRRYFSEEVVYLPCTQTYMPQAELPPVVPLPAKERDFITFGYFNNYIKLTAEALDLWARLLGSIPSSRMLFKAKQFDHPQPRARVIGAFAAAGVQPERLDFRGMSSWYEHVRTHGEVDIVLDPFPCTGGISTLEALSMGAPVVTLKGQTPFNRLAASHLSAVGLADWVAETTDQYLDIARGWARDILGLERLRAALRDRFTASPAGNPELYVRHVEATYRALWQRWCEGQRPQSGTTVSLQDPD